jgi:hypothetical protein
MGWASSIAEIRRRKEEVGLEYPRTHMGTSGATWVLRLSVSPPARGCDMRAPPLCCFAGYDGQCAQVLCFNEDPTELRELVNCLRDQVIEGFFSCSRNIYRLPTFRRVLTVFAFPLGCAFPQPVYFAPSLLVLPRIYTRRNRSPTSVYVHVCYRLQR